MKSLFHLLGGLVLTVSLSQAAIVISYVSQSAAGVGPNSGTLYTYDIDISSDTTVRNDDYIVIYDFGRLLSSDFSLAPGWTLRSTPFVGPTPVFQNPNDDPGIANVHIARTGGAVVGPAFLGFTDVTFSLESPGPTLQNGTNNVASQFLNNRGTAGTADDVEDGDTRDLPVPESGIPEPGTMGLLGASLFGLRFVLRGRVI